MSNTHHPIEPWAANLILMGVDRLDCAITTFGCVMMDLDDGDESTVGAIKWLYGALREEALNIRNSVAIAQDANGGVAKIYQGAAELA